MSDLNIQWGWGYVCMEKTELLYRVENCSLSQSFQAMGKGEDHMSTLAKSYPIIQEALSGSMEGHRQLETCSFFFYQISTWWSIQRSAGPNLNFLKKSWPYTLDLVQECGQGNQDSVCPLMTDPSNPLELQSWQGLQNSMGINCPLHPTAGCLRVAIWENGKQNEISVVFTAVN